MILLTGATGTSGLEIAKALLAQAERVRVLARDPEKAAKLLGDEVEIARGDFTDEESMLAAMEGVERTLMLAPPAQNMVELQSAFIRAAKRAGITHVVKLSAAGADARSPRLFGQWHGQSEEELKQSGMQWTMLRPSFFMQNLLGLAGMIKGGTIYMPTGEGKGAFVDVRDVAAVAAACLSDEGHEGKTYDITGPAALSYAEVAQVFSKVLGREVKFVDVPAEAAKKVMLVSGLPEWQAEAVNQLSEGMKQGLFDQVTSVVRDVGGKEPISLEQFARDQRSVFA
ncbi:MAG TPA: SDR family oxidoreductase [Tepidisphaeraceae bacterium]|jgi:uncharacterized protein YbjT (DUF2867 family)